MNNARAKRARLYAAQNRLCEACGRACVLPAPDQTRLPDDAFTIDHRLPLSRGGTNDESNLRGLCHACNQAKGDKVDTAAWWRMNGGVHEWVPPRHVPLHPPAAAPRVPLCDPPLKVDLLPPAEPEADALARAIETVLAAGGEVYFRP